MRHRHQGEGEVSAAPAFSGRCKEDEFEIELVVSFASLSLEDKRSDTMKDKDEQTALIGMAIGAAVISLVATQKQINQGSIVDELVRLGRQKATLPGNPFTRFITVFIPSIAAWRAAIVAFRKRHGLALSYPDHRTCAFSALLAFR